MMELDWEPRDAAHGLEGSQLPPGAETGRAEAVGVDGRQFEVVAGGIGISGLNVGQW